MRSSRCAHGGPLVVRWRRIRLAVVTDPRHRRSRDRTDWRRPAPPAHRDGSCLQRACPVGRRLIGARRLLHPYSAPGGRPRPRVDSPIRQRTRWSTDHVDERAAENGRLDRILRRSTGGRLHAGPALAETAEGVEAAGPNRRNAPHLPIDAPQTAGRLGLVLLVEASFPGGSARVVPRATAPARSEIPTQPPSWRPVTIPASRDQPCSRQAQRAQSDGVGGASRRPGASSRCSREPSG